MKSLASFKTSGIAALCVIGLVLQTAACTVNLDINLAPTSTTVMQTANVLPTASISPTANVASSPTPTITPQVDAASATLTATPREGEPRSLYFLASEAVWVLRPGADSAVRITPTDSIVTAFDVWPQDGRLAYGTASGKLYAVLPDGDPRMLVYLDTETPFPACFSAMSWSPDGGALAYTVEFNCGGPPTYTDYPSFPSGLSVFSLSEGRSTWLMSNRYQTTSGENVNHLRRFTAPQWSPDGQALLVMGVYYEWINQHWLYPLQFAEDDRYLHTQKNKWDEVDYSWTNATWMPGSDTLLISGRQNSIFSDLILTSRDGEKTDKVIDGEMANLYIYDAYPVPPDSYLPGQTAGIHSGPGRFIFLANCPNCPGETGARLFVQGYYGGTLQGQVVGPDLCKADDDFGNPNEPNQIIWNPDFSAGVVVCGWNEIYTIQMRHEEPQLVDMLPYLPEFSLRNMPQFRWGELD